MFLKLSSLLKNLETSSRFGELDFRPRPPDYRLSGGLFKVAYPNTGAQRPSLSDDGRTLTFSLGNQVNRWFGIKSFDLPMPANLDYFKVQGKRI